MISFTGIFRVFSVIFLSTTFIILGGCGTSGTSTQANSVGAIAAKLVWNSGESAAKVTASQVNTLPQGVTTINISVTGPSISVLPQSEMDFQAA